MTFRDVMPMMAAFVTVVVGPARVGLAHELARQMDGAQTASPAALVECTRAQQQALLTVEAANTRLEAARQQNSVASMRTAVDELQGAFRETQAQMAKCAALQTVAPAASTAATPQGSQAAATVTSMAGMDHSKMNMGATSKRSVPAAAVEMDHSKMGRVMPMGATAPKAEYGHGAMKTGSPALPVMAAERLADPACPDAVNDISAARATYQRKVYYFCSAKDRGEFRKDPAAYLKKRPR